MSFFLILKKCLDAFKVESELNLAYLYGEKSKVINKLQLKKKFSGPFFQFFIFLFYTIKKLSFLNSKKSNKFIYAYVESNNQYTSISGTIIKFIEKNYEIHLINESFVQIDEKLKKYSKPIQINFKLFCVILLLFVLKAPLLYINLKKLSNYKEISYFINQFYMSYFYLPYFLDQLCKYKPQFVLMSNDINVSCRSLKLAAEILNIKTVYLQHGSISTLFPPLGHNYVFLDGQASLDIYHKNEIDNSLNLKKNSERHIFLSGNKRKLIKLDLNKKDQIGIAINRLDDLEIFEKICFELINLGFKVRIRFHPGTSNSIKNKFINTFKNKPFFRCKDSNKESISDFFGNLCCLISGESGIHLEAAICGVVPIYYKTKADFYDMFGFIKYGIAYEANKAKEIVSIVNKIKLNKLKVNKSAVKYFSSTFLTEWQGREDELVANHILSISKNIDPKKLYGYYCLK